PWPIPFPYTTLFRSSPEGKIIAPRRRPFFTSVDREFTSVDRKGETSADPLPAPPPLRAAFSRHDDHFGLVDAQRSVPVRSEEEVRSVRAQPRIALVPRRVQLRDRLGRGKRLVEGRAPGHVQIAAVVVARRQVDVERQPVVGEKGVHGRTIVEPKLRERLDARERGIDALALREERAVNAGAVPLRRERHDEPSLTGRSRNVLLARRELAHQLGLGPRRIAIRAPRHPNVERAEPALPL